MQTLINAENNQYVIFFMIYQHIQIQLVVFTEIFKSRQQRQIFNIGFIKCFHQHFFSKPSFLWREKLLAVLTEESKTCRNVALPLLKGWRTDSRSGVTFLTVTLFCHMTLMWLHHTCASQTTITACDASFSKGHLMCFIIKHHLQNPNLMQLLNVF